MNLNGLFLAYEYKLKRCGSSILAGVTMTGSGLVNLPCAAEK